MTINESRAFLIALNPIVSALAEPSLLEHARENMGTVLAPGVGIEYLRLRDAVEAVGWEEAVTLPEIQRLLDVCAGLVA